jgi:hypothetical protein
METPCSVWKGCYRRPNHSGRIERQTFLQGFPVTRPESGGPLLGQRQTQVIKNIKMYSTLSLTLCPTIGVNRLPDFSRQYA